MKSNLSLILGIVIAILSLGIGRVSLFAQTNIVVNGTFESGNFDGWTLNGAGSAVSNLGSIPPPNGSFMGLIHTGTGSVELGGPSEFSTSNLSQSFDVASTLFITFDYNFLSNEFPSFVGSAFNDTFKVELTDSSGNVTLLALADVNTSIFTPIGELINGSGFSLFATSGQTGFINSSKTVVVPSGTTTIEFKVADVGDSAGASVALIDSVAIITLDVPESVAVDINPQSCPNSLKVNGSMRAAILGTYDFDVTQVDPTSVRLEGVAPFRSTLKDVATPFEPFTGKTDALDCTDAGPDGYLDLTLKFDRPNIVEAIESALGREVEDGEVLILTLEGVLFDGTPIVGEDVVVIKKRGE